MKETRTKENNRNWDQSSSKMPHYAKKGNEELFMTASKEGNKKVLYAAFKTLVGGRSVICWSKIKISTVIKWNQSSAIKAKKTYLGTNKSKKWYNIGYDIV